MNPDGPSNSTVNGQTISLGQRIRGTSEMAERIRGLDWGVTPLGTIASWSAALLTSVNTMLGAPVATGLFWGPDLRMIYNDAYRDLLGAKHPTALGERVKVVWWDAWEAIEPDVRTVLEGRGSAVQKDVLIPVNRLGTLEDAYWNYNLSPVYELDGSIVAVLVTCQEVTQVVLSERLLRASEDRILHSIGDAVIVTDSSARITRMNPVAEALTGWRGEEAAGFLLEHVFRIINESTRLPVESPAEKVKQSGTVVGLANHTILVRRDGSEVHIDDSAAPIHDGQGTLIGIVLVFRDIEERRQAEEAIQKSEERFRSLIELSPVGVTISDPATERFLFANDEMSRMVGYDRPEIEAMCSRDLTYAEDQEITRLFFERVQEGTTGGQIVIKRYVRKDGVQIWVQVRAKVIEDSEGNRRVLATLEDITERLQTQTALEESERRLKTFVDAIPTLAWMARADGGIFWYNRSWYEYTGKTPVEMEGWGWQSVHDPATLPAVLERWMGSIRTGQPFKMVFPIKGNDGVYRSFMTRVVPVRNASGELTEWFGTNTEVDELEHARLTLAAERSRLAAVIDHVPVGLVFADANGRITGGNPQVEKILRHPLLLSEGAASYGEWVSYHPDGRRVEAYEYPLARTIEDGGVYSGEYQYQRGDGTTGWVQFTSAPILNNEGETTGAVATTLDIDDRKRAENELIQAQEVLRKSEKLAVAGRLAATISHEINNPLEAVTNLLYLLRTGTHDDLAREYLVAAEEELARVTQIVTHSLRFHRQSTRPTDEKMSSILDSVVAIYRSRLVPDFIEIKRDYRNTEAVHCYSSELRQVFGNFVGNAFDAIRQGGTIILRTRDSIDLQTGERGVRVTVADTGHGMDQATLQRIFEPFFTTKGINGTGLGLWISRDILNKHRAKMRVRSRKGDTGSGTVFSMFLPLRAMAAKIDPSQSES